MGVLLGLALVVPAAAFAKDPTAEQILAKVSQTYCGLSSFRFVERREQSVGGVKPILGPLDLPAPFGSRPAWCTTDLAISTPGKIRLVVTSREAEISLVSDGRMTGWYTTNLSGYTEITAAPLLQELWAHPVRLISDDLARYRSLPHEPGRAKLRGEETLSLEGQQVRCYVVDLLAGSVWRTLWVDEQRFIVLRDEGHFSQGTGDPNYFANAGSETSRMTKAVLGPISDDVFQFPVPTGARPPSSAAAGPAQSAEMALADLLIGSERQDEHILQPAGHPLQGRKARDFTAASLGGKNVRLRGFHGKTVVLDFSASWCKPCQGELAAIQKLHDELGSKGVVFLGIDDESPETVENFVKAHGYTFPMLLDSNDTVHGLYGVRLAPTTVVIDRKGKIAAHYVGAGGEAGLRRALKPAGLNTTP